MLLPKQLGVTLPEILIGAVLAAILGSLLLGLMVNNTGVFYKETTKVSEGLDINDALASIRSNTKLSEAVLNSYLNGGTTYTSNGTSLVLQLASINASGVIDNTFDYVVYFRTGDKLLYKLFPGAGSQRKSINQILAGGVDTLTFQYFDATGLEVSPTAATRVKVSIKLKKAAGNVNQLSVATSEASLRND